MFTFTDTPDEFQYKEGAFPLIRVGLGLFGVLFMLFPFFFLYAIGGINIFTSGSLLLVILFFIAVLFSSLICGFCFKVTFFVPVQTFVFKKKEMVLNYITKLPFRKESEESYDFSAIQNLEVHRSTGSMDFPSYWISFSIHAERDMIIGNFNERIEAENRVDQINNIIGTL